MEYLQRMEAKSVTSFDLVVREFIHSTPQRGLVIVLSDFLDDGDCLRPLQYLADYGHELLLIQIYGEEDRTPPWNGELELVDAETQAEVRLQFDEVAREQYTRAFDEYTGALQQLAVRNGGRFASVSTGTTLEDIIFGALVRTRGDCVRNRAQAGLWGSYFRLKPSFCVGAASEPRKSRLEKSAARRNAGPTIPTEEEMRTRCPFLICRWGSSSRCLRRRVEWRSSFICWTAHGARWWSRRCVSGRQPNSPPPLCGARRSASRGPWCCNCLVSFFCCWRSRNCASASSRASLATTSSALDTSAWMNAVAPTGASQSNQPRHSLMDLARRQAALYVRSLPGSDRVMLVRADALATPATPFLSDKLTVLRAIADSRPGSTALDLGQALGFAARTQQLSANRAGEIVYAGPARIVETDEAIPAVSNLRVLAVGDGIANSGIRHVGLRRSPDDANVWDVYVACRNYGTQPRTGTIAIGFGGAPAGAQRITLEPNADHETAFKLRTHAAGLPEVRLFPSDDFPDDNRAVLEIPAYGGLGVTIYSDSPDVLRPLFGANSRISAVFKGTSQYKPDTAGLVVLDHFRPKVSPQGDSLWLDPPPTESPIPVRARVDHPGAIRWATDQAMAA